MKQENLLKYAVLIALVVFIISYGYLAFYHSQPFLFNKVVHEDGKLTLLETIFTFDHFLGQLPMIFLFSFFIPGSFLLFGSEIDKGKLNKPKLKNLLLLLSFIAIVFLLVVFAASINRVGLDETIKAIFQFRENPTTYQYGGNWKMMFFSNIILFFSTLLISAFVRVVLLKQQPKKQKLAKTYILIGIVIIILLSILFKINMQVFTKPRWLAHSVRELLTNGLITFPLVFGLFYFIETKYNKPKKLKKATPWLYFIFIITFVLVAYNLVALINVDISGVAQAPDFAKQGKLSVPYLAFFHFFEHVLDYIYITILSSILYIFALIKI
ncbi:MAG: hypothetical protein MAG795_00119 [Candidatus Woesearchaeota archaeon]|nr:hypothetical protein [Candidatus Woesearchaeota archaeon]